MFLRTWNRQMVSTPMFRVVPGWWGIYVNFPSREFNVAIIPTWLSVSAWLSRLVMCTDTPWHDSRSSWPARSFRRYQLSQRKMGTQDASLSDQCPFCQIANNQTDTEILLGVSTGSSLTVKKFNSWSFLTLPLSLGVFRMMSWSASATWSLAPHIITLLWPGHISRTAKISRGTTYRQVRGSRTSSWNLACVTVC